MAAQKKQPNIIVFFTDQQRHDATGLHGNPLDLTPNLDRLARGGTHVYNSFTCQPVCGPARSCLQTGMYATNTGCYRNGIDLNQDHATLAKLFNQAGYRTGYIGKWHLADSGGRYAVKEEQRGGYQDWLAVETLEFSVDEYHTVLYDNDNQAVKLPGYRVDALTDAAIRYVNDKQDEPFFLMVSYIEPHHQNHVDDYPPPMGYRERYQGRYTPPDLQALGGSAAAHLGGYYGQVKRLDESLGRLQDALHSLGLEDDTVVLFTSDHACHFKTRNAEYKRSCHESSIRVPTALWGGPFSGGGQINELVSLVDLPPTLLDAAGIEAPEQMEGRSILPLINRTAEAWPDDVFRQISESQQGRAVRTQRWKYAVTADYSDHPGASSYREAFLYDLKYDPYELTNLIGSGGHRVVADRMLERLLVYTQRVEGVSPQIVKHEIMGDGGQRFVTAEEVQM